MEDSSSTTTTTTTTTTTESLENVGQSSSSVANTHTNININTNTNNNNDNHIVKKGDNIILLLSDKKYLYDVQVGKKGNVKIGKTQVHADKFIGLCYGSTYEVLQGNLVPFNTKTFLNENLVVEEDERRDNSLLVDDNKSQSMTQEQILALRKETSGSEVIKALTENSATFAQKTAFSQEKYIKKKQQKHLFTVKIIRATAKSIATAYYSKNPGKIHFLRPDSLAYILSLANLHPNSTNLVIEDCVGVVTGSVLERLGGHATLLSAYFGGSPPKFSFFNFSPEILKSVFHFHLSNTLGMLYDNDNNSSNKNNNNSNNTNNNNNISNNTNSNNEGDKSNDNTNNTNNNNSSEGDKNSNNDDQKEGDSVSDAGDKKRKRDERDDVEMRDSTPESKQPKKKEAEVHLNENATLMEASTSTQQVSETAETSKTSKEVTESSGSGKPLVRQTEIIDMLKAGVDSLILVAPQYSPTSIFEHVFRLLRPGGVFVVFSPSTQPLVDLHEYLRGKAVNLNLSEIWFREYQVLPLRTHPTMSMDGSSGFVLSGIRVVDRLPPSFYVGRHFRPPRYPFNSEDYVNAYWKKKKGKGKEKGKRGRKGSYLINGFINN